MALHHLVADRTVKTANALGPYVVSYGSNVYETQEVRFPLENHQALSF